MKWLTHSIRNKLLAISGLGTLLFLGATLLGLWSAWQSIQAFEGVVAAHHVEATKILETQLEFKTQVQEWKNVLLRGSDPEALGKYWGYFEKHEGKVAANLDELLEKVKEPVAMDLLQQIRSAHKTLGESYRKGLQAFKAANFDAKAGDSVQGGQILVEFE